MPETLLLKQPTVSAEHVAFLYAGDTWTVDRQDGSRHTAPRRLTAQRRQHVLFCSSRDTPTLRYRRLYTVGLDNALPQALPMPMAERGAYSPDGSRMAYTRIPEPFWSWKRYRGGQTVPIWLIDLSTCETVEIPHENASDTFPSFSGGGAWVCWSASAPGAG